MKSKLEDDGTGAPRASDDPDNPYSDVILATRQKVWIPYYGNGLLLDCLLGSRVVEADKHTAIGMAVDELLADFQVPCMLACCVLSVCLLVGVPATTATGPI